jgi:3-dehydroquinate synthase
MTDSNKYSETLEELLNDLNQTNNNYDLVIVDSNLEFYNFEKLLNTDVLYLQISESTKNLVSVERVWNALFEHNLNRLSNLLIIGGGVLLDVCAFAASTYKRGISFCLVPTTLLAMVDAAHGGKNGFNNNYGKNQIGTFTEPKSIFVCHELLDSLSEKDYKDGLIELIKHGLIGSSEIYEQLSQGSEYKVSLDTIKKGIKIKLDIVSEDFTELNKRKLLNFGHTIGHLIEKDSEFKVSHGEAVAIGIYYELLLSKKHMGLPQEVINSYLKYIEKINYNYTYKFSKGKDSIMEALKNDKKSLIDNVDIVLLSGISMPNIINLSFDELFEVIDY